MTGSSPSQCRLPAPCLCLVTDRRQCGSRSLENVVAAAVAGGVTMVQLRETDLPAVQLWELAQRLRSLVEGKALFIINDRIDVALAVGANGVQLSGRSLPPAAARSIVGPGMLLGRSVHSPAEAAAAQAEGADFAVLGTVFQTASHPGIVGGGLELVRAARAATAIPIVAIGGIKASNAAAVMGAGADGVAVISAILGAEDPRDAAAALWESIKGVRPAANV